MCKHLCNQVSTGIRPHLLTAGPSQNPSQLSSPQAPQVFRVLTNSTTTQTATTTMTTTPTTTPTSCGPPTTYLPPASHLLPPPPRQRQQSQEQMRMEPRAWPRQRTARPRCRRSSQRRTAAGTWTALCPDHWPWDNDFAGSSGRGVLSCVHPQRTC